MSISIRRVSEMPPMGTLVGHALPRIFINQLGSSEQSKDQTRGRLGRGLEIIEDAAIKAQTPRAILAHVAEGIGQADVNHQEVLSEVLSSGWLVRQGAVSMDEDVKQALETNAPNVWGTFNQMTYAEIIKNNIS